MDDRETKENEGKKFSTRDVEKEGGQRSGYGRANRDREAGGGGLVVHVESELAS